MQPLPYAPYNHLIWGRFAAWCVTIGNLFLPAVMLYAAYREFERGELLDSAVGVGFALLWLTICLGFYLSFARRVKADGKRVTADQNQQTVHISWRKDSMLGLTLNLVVIASLLTGIGLYIVAGSTPTGWWLAGLGLLLLLFVPDSLLRVFRKGELEISKEGIKAKTWDNECFIKWDDVTTVTSKIVPAGLSYHQVLEVEAQNWENKPRPKFLFRPNYKKPILSIPATALDIEPEKLIAMLRLYSLNPSTRFEIGMMSSLTRIKNN